MDFKYKIKNGKVIITAYTGTAKKVVIPDEIDGMQVITLDTYCFYFSTIEDVEIPDSIKNINGYCFIGCKYLKKVKLPKKLKRLGNMAFSGCSALSEIDGGDNIDRFTLYRAFCGINRKRTTMVGFPKIK